MVSIKTAHHAFFMEHNRFYILFEHIINTPYAVWGRDIRIDHGTRTYHYADGSKLTVDQTQAYPTGPNPTVWEVFLDYDGRWGRNTAVYKDNKWHIVRNK